MQTVTFRKLIGVKVKQLQAVITFLDFSKAFNSIHREQLTTILSTHGVPKKIPEAINIIYKDTVAK